MFNVVSLKQHFIFLVSFSALNKKGLLLANLFVLLDLKKVV